MSGEQIRVLFEAEVSMAEVVDTLKLAELATQSLHGSGRTELEVSWDVDRPRHAVAISTTTQIGQALALIFLGYARREFGPESVNVVRGNGAPSRETGGLCR